MRDGDGSLYVDRLRRSVLSKNDIEGAFIAHIDELRGGMGADGRRQGEVGMTLYHEDDAIKAYAYLDADQYQLALRAHMENRRVVIRGTLNRRARLSVVSEVQAAELLDQR